MSVEPRKRRPGFSRRTFLAGLLVLLAGGPGPLHAGDARLATFAAGCFWCMEALYERVPGVLEVVSGFSGGSQPNPTYESHDGHTETVQITYDPDRVTYEQLLRIFFKSHDPTNPRGVEPDFGSSYRPALFYRTVAELATIQKVRKELQPHYKKPIATEIVQFERFWPAEAYHQDFVRNHPDHPYVRNVSLPRVEETLKELSIATPTPTHAPRP